MGQVTYYHSKWKAIGAVFCAGIILTLFLGFAFNTENGLNFGFGWVLFCCALLVGIYGLIHLLDFRPQIVLDDDGFKSASSARTWDEVVDLRLQIRTRSIARNPKHADDHSVLTFCFADGSFQTLDVTSLDVHGDQIFDEIQRFWKENHQREDLRQRTRSLRTQEQIKQVRQPPAALSDLATHPFGASLIGDGIDYFPDWSAAMLREFDGLSSAELEHCFEIGKMLNEHDPSQWEDVLAHRNLQSGIEKDS